MAEVGSGTGFVAEALLARGYRVLAVEPNGPMREAAERRLGGRPGFASIAGRAEATMRARLGALFDAHERGGAVAIAYLTVAHFGRLAP